MTSEELGSELDGEVAIVIGASSGIGSATAKPLASRGASVVVATRREGELEELAVVTEDDGGDTLVAPTDVTVDDGIDTPVGAMLDEHGRIDILVNNIGLMSLAHIGEAGRKMLQTIIDVNLTSLITLIHAVVPTMMEQESDHIANLPSAVGRLLQADSSYYSAARAGAKMSSDSLRPDVAGAGIHVSSIEPGVADAELLDHIPDEEAQKNIRDYVGMMDVLAPGDIARTITFVVTQPECVDINEVLICPPDQVQS